MAPRPHRGIDPALRRRLASGIVLALLVLVPVVVGGVLYLTFLVVLAAGLARELARLLETGRARTVLALGLLLVSAGTLVAVRILGAGRALAVMLGMISILAILAVSLRRRPLVWAAAGLYLSVPGLALLWLRMRDATGLYWVLWLLLVIAATDTGAYLVGRRVGGARLAPRISPGKTWAGLAGGMVAAGIVGALMGAWMFPGRPAAALLLSAEAIALAVVGQMGDLTESWLKRRSGVKDSGTLLPGHGGLLDRFDGLLFAAPAHAGLLLLLDRLGNAA